MNDLQVAYIDKALKKRGKKIPREKIANTLRATQNNLETPELPKDNPIAQAISVSLTMAVLHYGAEPVTNTVLNYLPWGLGKACTKLLPDLPLWMCRLPLKMNALHILGTVLKSGIPVAKSTTAFHTFLEKTLQSLLGKNARVTIKEHSLEFSICGKLIRVRYKGGEVNLHAIATEAAVFGLHIFFPKYTPAYLINSLPTPMNYATVPLGMLTYAACQNPAAQEFCELMYGMADKETEKKYADSWLTSDFGISRALNWAFGKKETKPEPKRSTRLASRNAQPPAL